MRMIPVTTRDGLFGRCMSHLVLAAQDGIFVTPSDFRITERFRDAAVIFYAAAFDRDSFTYCDSLLP